jgi:Uma2 family endonuclease
MRAKAKFLEGLKMSFEDFLVREEWSKEKHEFHRGLVVLMPGGTLPHAICISGIVRELGILAKGSGCTVVSSDLGVWVESDEAFVYPDATVLCAKPKFWHRNSRVLTNPKMLIEVLSPSTRDYDMSAKFASYCQLPSFDEYLLLESTSVEVHQWLRDSAGKWQRKKYRGEDAQIPIRSLGKNLRLLDVYEGVPGITFR